MKGLTGQRKENGGNYSNEKGVVPAMSSCNVICMSCYTRCTTLATLHVMPQTELVINRKEQVVTALPKQLDIEKLVATRQ